MGDEDRVRPEARVDFDDFVVGSSGRLLRVAQLLTGDRGRAEDLVQDAYARAFLRWDKIRADDPWAYVRRCVVNGYTDWWRRRPWREQPYADLSPWSRPVCPTRCGGLAADRDALSLALAQLTRRERAVVVLRFYADLSEVADRRGARASRPAPSRARPCGPCASCASPPTCSQNRSRRRHDHRGRPADPAR